MMSSWLAIAGALHFLQLPSLAYLIRGTLDLGSDLGRLSPINRRLVALFVGAVAFLILGLGALVAADPSVFLDSVLGRRLCVLLAAFWTCRAAVQVWLGSVWPRELKNRIVYFALLGLYVGFALTYGLAAWSC